MESYPALALSDIHDMSEAPMSRTHQYRKVMKPLLERKRRARINKCLDELKDLMVFALQSEGESITKLEKADVLELTVKHLRKLKRQNALGLTPQATYAGRFKAGYAHCAQEVSKFMAGPTVDLDVHVSTKLLSHLSSCIQALETISPSILAASNSGSIAGPTPPPTHLSAPIPVKPDADNSRRPFQPVSTLSLLRLQGGSAASVAAGGPQQLAAGGAGGMGAWRPW